MSQCLPWQALFRRKDFGSLHHLALKLALGQHGKHSSAKLHRAKFDNNEVRPGMHCKQLCIEVRNMPFGFRATKHSKGDTTGASTMNS